MILIALLTIIVVFELSFCVASSSYGEGCVRRFEYWKLESKPDHCMSPVCELPLSIAFYDDPPYIARGPNGSLPQGLLFRLIQTAIDICCQSCQTNVKWTGYQNALQLASHAVLYTALLPISTHKDHTTLSGRPYVPIIHSPDIVYLHLKSDEQMRHQIETVIHDLQETWPILVISVLTTLLAGFCIWLLDTWSNQDEFPRLPLRGGAEGAWWAFVSMTTVGYGDRAPRSCLARIFGVIWITFGILVSSILTAVMSSSFMKVSLSHHGSIRGKNVAVVNDFSIQASVVASEGGIPKSYNSITGMTEALVKGECEVMAMKRRHLLYHWDRLSSDLPLEVISVVKVNQKAMGLVFSQHGGFNVSGPAWASFLDGFFKENQDNLDLMISIAERSVPFMLGEEKVIFNGSMQKTILGSLKPRLITFIWILVYTAGGVVIIAGVIELCMLKRMQSRKADGSGNATAEANKTHHGMVLPLLRIEGKLLSEVRKHSTVLAEVYIQTNELETEMKQNESALFSFGENQEMGFTNPDVF